MNKISSIFDRAISLLTGLLLFLFIALKKIRNRFGFVACFLKLPAKISSALKYDFWVKLENSIRVDKQKSMAVITCIMLSACSSSEDELSRYIHSVKNRPPSPRTIEPIPEFKPLEKFSFPSNDKRRSPFKRIQHESKMDANSPNINRPKQPLEAFPLDALKFVGILKEGNSTWALIAQPGGMVTPARVGDYMGKNYGQIIRIKDNGIDIEETVQLGGRWEKKRFSLNMNTLD